MLMKSSIQGAEIEGASTISDVNEGAYVRKN